MSWYSFLVTVVGSTVAASVDDVVVGDERLERKDWGVKATLLDQMVDAITADTVVFLYAILVFAG